MKLNVPTTLDNDQLPTSLPDDYLGDGVYASHDGYHIILDLRGQDSTTRIALEPAVLRALNQYNERAQQLNRERES